MQLSVSALLRASSFASVAPLAALAVLTVSACSGGAGGPESLGTSSEALNTISGCDYSFARPSPSSLSSMGYKFVCRYLSGDPGGGKDLTASEQSSLEAGGIDIVLNWETTGTDATSGYSAGVSDATAAKSEAEGLGQPSNRPIYFSIDFDAGSGDAASINAYFQGVASVLGVARTGVYGGYYIVKELFDAKLVSWGWQTYAWSSGNWDSRAQLRQVQNDVDNGQLDADTGMVPDYGQYGPGSPVDADGGGGYYAAGYVAQSWPLASTVWSLTACQTVASSITLKNTGTLPWNADTRIGTTQPRDGKSDFADATWLSVNRAAAVTGTIAPGDTFEFKFDFHAPPTPGTYTQYFGVVQEGVAWFSDPGQGGPVDSDIEANIEVTGAAGNCDVDPGVPDGGPTASSDGGKESDAAPEGDAGKAGIDGGTAGAGDGGGTGTKEAGGETADAGAGDADAFADADSGGGKGCSLSAASGRASGTEASGTWVVVAGALFFALGRRRGRQRHV
jgi:hypothetical protein